MKSAASMSRSSSVTHLSEAVFIGVNGCSIIIGISASFSRSLLTFGARLPLAVIVFAFDLLALRALPTSGRDSAVTLLSCVVGCCLIVAGAWRASCAIGIDTFIFGVSPAVFDFPTSPGASSTNTGIIRLSIDAIGLELIACSVFRIVGLHAFGLINSRACFAGIACIAIIFGFCLSGGEIVRALSSVVSLIFIGEVPASILCNTTLGVLVALMPDVDGVGNDPRRSDAFPSDLVADLDLARSSELAVDSRDLLRLLMNFPDCGSRCSTLGAPLRLSPSIRLVRFTGVLTVCFSPLAGVVVCRAYSVLTDIVCTSSLSESEVMTRLFL